MSQKEKERPGLLDFPLDPTPSLEAYIKFTTYIHKYINMFHSSSDGLSIGPIILGTPDRPLITAPIEMDPREIERYLRPTTEVLEETIGEANKSIMWTRKVLAQTDTRSPEAENRIQFLEKIVDDIRRLLRDHNGFAWHPRCHEQIRNRVQSSFIPGEPGIPIQITIFV